MKGIRLKANRALGLPSRSRGVPPHQGMRRRDPWFGSLERPAFALVALRAALRPLFQW